MAQKNYIPPDYDGIKVVSDLCALLQTDFGPFANVILYPRRLKGDFDGLAEAMAAHFGLADSEIFIKYTDKKKLEEFQQTLTDKTLLAAMDVLMTDMEFFHHSGARPHVRILKTYTEDETTHDFHVDGVMQNFDRFMTCYNAPVTEFVKNSDVLKVQGHKAICKPDAMVYAFRPGDIWKQRVRNKTSSPYARWLKIFFDTDRRRAFVHRALRSERPRLMLVGDLRLDTQNRQSK
ncbi:MAG: hypothetical protein H6858_01345 [Rhodospirillales bacterium]|nr:hypothetical protein [Alphaproteobacteria bacterium]MCB1840050.1 hypothetical protein [Alphaproteobacteria bacterium]MCB9976226.1 hypothetical protein [Rhodospirillales bacterium]